MASLHQQLQQHLDTASLDIRHLFEIDDTRANKYMIEAAGLYLDYSRNRVSDQTLALLTALADECKLSAAIQDLLAGVSINNTEQRPALHTALRASADSNIKVNGRNIMPDIEEVRQRIKSLCDSVNSGGMERLYR